ncbi:MAG: phytanoyl-CoA dioxygenase family protein, partial [Pseudomonadota bacterium]
HQDSQAGWDKYADFFISVLVCIDEATVANGCLEVVSGHHKRGLFRSWEPMTADDMKGMSFIPVPTRPGDLIFFDCYAPHQSQPNLSDKIRRLYYATYNKLSAGDHQAQYYADKRKSYPPDIERDPAKTYVFRV